MDFNSLLEDLRNASENLVKNSSNRKPLSTVYCHKISKTVDKVSTWHSDYESVITGLWVIGSHFTEYIDHLAQVPSLKEAASRLFRECAKAVLNIQWQNLEEDNEIRQKFIISQANLNRKLVPLNFQRFKLLETLLENPWTDPTLAKIMGGEAEDDEEKEEVRSYIEKEDAVILQLRVDMMLKENCEEYALNLCNSCLLHPELKRDLKLRKTQLSLLYKLGHRDKLQEECQNLSIQEAVIIIKQLQTRATKEICTILAQTFMVQHWIRQSDHKANKELLRLWIKHQSLADKDQDRFKESVWAIAKLSQSTDQILFFIDILREQCGKTYIQLYVDMCIFAINVDKGQMEDNIKQGKTDLVKARKEDMAAICGKLACLNHHTSIKVARLCALTAFALKPSIEMFTSISKFYGTEKDKCCTSCNNQKADFGNGIVNPATLFEVERLLCMLRPDYLNPDDSFSNIKLLCERFCKENNLNILLEPPPTPQPVPQDSQLRVVQIEGFGKPKATSVKPSNVFEAVPSPNVGNAQAIYRQRFQTMQNKNIRPSLSSTPQNQGPPAQYSRPNILQSSPRYNPPTVQIHMKSGGTTSTLQQQRQQHIYRNVQPSVASNMPQQHYMYSQSNHTNSTQQGQAKNPTKLNPQLIQYIQSAVRQNSSALQDLMKHPDKDIVRTVLNMMNTPGGKGSHRSLLPQQQQPTRMTNPKRLPATPSGLPTVSTLLKTPTNSLHHGQAAMSSAQPHSSSSSVSTHPHLAPKSPYPHQINDNPSSQTSSSCSPSFNSLSDQQKVESFRLAKVQAGNIRSAMQSCISTTGGPQQKQQILAKQMSGSTIIVNQSPHFQPYSGVSKVSNQVSNANLPNRAIPLRPSMNLDRKPTGNEYSISVSSRPSQHNTIMSASSKTQQQQAQQPSRNNPALFNQNTPSGLASFGGLQQQSSSHQKQSVLSSDELSGSIMGIDDTIITELLQDSGLLANTFPDIEVDFNLDDYFDKKREGKIQLPNSSSSQNVVSQPMSIENKIALSSSSSSVHQRNAVSSSLNNTINFAQNQSSFLSSNNTGSSPRTHLGYTKQNFPFTESSSSSTTTSMKPKIHTDSNSLNQRQFPDEIAVSTSFDSAQPAKSSNSRSWSLDQMSVEQIREVMKQEQIEGEVTMDSSNNATYRCIICSLAFQILDDLREHVRNVCKPGLQSSSVYNNKIKQDRANSAKAGLETTTVFQCLRCFELCISDIGIKEHRLTCKRVPTVPPDIKNAALTKAKTPPSSRCSTPKASMPPKTPPKTPPTCADKSSKLPDMLLPFPFLNTQEVLNTLQAVAASGKMKARDNVLPPTPSDTVHSHTSNNISTTTQPAPSTPTTTTTTTNADCKKETLVPQVKPEITSKEKPIKPPDKPENLPPMKYSEISGSGGSKFYRCKNCAQTLCSFESLCSHWKECATKPLLLTARNHRPFPLEQEEELEEGEIRPLVGKVLQNVLDVIKAVAKGDIGETPNLDAIDLANSDTETIFSLKNPCKAEPPAKPSGKVSKKEFPTHPFPGPDNGSKVDVEKSCNTTQNANRKISCLQMKDSSIKIEKDGKDESRHIKLSRDVSLKSGKSTKDFNILKRDEEESETTEKEDEQSDNSETGTVSKVEISRDVPPKLRDRNSRSKPVRFVSESYVSPYRKTGLNKLNKPDTPSMERRTDGEEKLASVSRGNKESGKLSPSKRKVRGNVEDTKNSHSSKEVENESFSCVVCSKSCHSRRILIQHYAGKHLQPYTMKTLTDGSSYFCHLCQKSFNTFMHYMHHVPNHASAILKKMAQFSKPSSSRNQLWSSRIAASRGITSTAGQQKGKISPNRVKALQSKRKAAKSARARLKKTLLTTSAAKSSTTVSLNGEVGPGNLMNPKRKTSGILTRRSAQQMLQRKLLKRKIENKRAGFDKRFSMSENEDSNASSSPYISDATDDDEYAASEEEADSDSALQEPRQTRNRSRSTVIEDNNTIRVDKSLKVSSSSLAHFPELSKISNILPSVSVHRLTQSEVDRFTKSRENETILSTETTMTPVEQGPTDHFKVPPVENVKSPPSFQLSFESFLNNKITPPAKTGKEGVENKIQQSITSPTTRSGVNSDTACELTKDDDEDDHHSFSSENNIMISVRQRRCSVNLGQKVDMGILKTKPEDDKEPSATESSGITHKDDANIGKEALHLPSCAVLLDKDELVQQKTTTPENPSIVLSPGKQSTILSAQEDTEVDITDKTTDSVVSTSTHLTLESDGRPDLPNETVQTTEQREQNGLLDSVWVDDSSVSENTIESGKSEKESACEDSSSGQSMEDDKRAKDVTSSTNDGDAVCEEKSDIVFSADMVEDDSLPQALSQSIPLEVITNPAPSSLKEEEDQTSHLDGEEVIQDSPQCIKIPVTTEGLDCSQSSKNVDGEIMTSKGESQEIVMDSLGDETEKMKTEGESSDSHPSQIDENEILNKSNIVSDMKQFSAEIVTPEKGTSDNSVEESGEQIEDKANTELGDENSGTACCEISASSIPNLANDLRDYKEQESVDKMSEALDISSKETDRSVVESELKIDIQPNENADLKNLDIKLELKTPKEEDALVKNSQPVVENGPKAEVDAIVSKEVDIPIDVSVRSDLNKKDAWLEEDDKKQKDEKEEDIADSSLDCHMKRGEDITEVTRTKETEIDSLLPATASETERVEFESDNQGLSDSRGSKNYVNITDQRVDKDNQMEEEEEEKDTVEVAISETNDLSTACSGGIDGDEDAKSLVDLARDGESKDVVFTEESLEAVIEVSQELIPGGGERGDESNCNLELNKTEEENIEDDSTSKLSLTRCREATVESKVDGGSGEMCNEKTIDTSVDETGETTKVEMGVEASDSCNKSGEVSECEVSESKEVKEEEVEPISDSSLLSTIPKEGVKNTEITSLSVQNIEEKSGEVTADVKQGESDLDGQDGCIRNREDDGENCDENVASIKEVDVCEDGTTIVREDIIVSEVDERKNISAEDVDLSNVKDSLSLDKVTDTDSEGLERGKEGNNDEDKGDNDADNDDMMKDDGISTAVVEACESDEICNNNDTAGEKSGDLNGPVVEEEEEEGVNKLWGHEEMKTGDNAVSLNEDDEKEIEQGETCSDTVLVDGKNSEEVEDNEDNSVTTGKTHDDDNGAKETKDLIVEEHQICTSGENTQIEFPCVAGTTYGASSDSCVDIEGLKESSATLMNTTRQNNDSDSGNVSGAEIRDVVTTLEIDELPVVEEEEEEKTEDIKSQDCLEPGRKEKTECEDSETMEEEDEAEAIQDIDFLFETEPTSGHQDIISRVESSSSDPDTDKNILERGVETCKDSEINGEVGNVSNDEKLDVDSANVSVPFNLPNHDTEDVRVDAELKTVAVTEEEATSNAQLMDTSWRSNDMNSDDDISNVDTKNKIEDSDCANVSDGVTTLEVDGTIDEMPPVVGEEEEKTEDIKNQDCGQGDKTECKDCETREEEEDEKVEAIQDIDFLFETETASDHQDIISRVEPSSSSRNFDGNSLERDIGACKDSEINSFEACKERDVEVCKDSENNSIELSKASENISTELSKDSENISTELSKDSENINTELSKDSENISTELSKDSENISTELSKDSENISIETSQDSENNSTESSKETENNSIETSQDSENNSIETSKDSENNSSESSKDSENNRELINISNDEKLDVDSASVSTEDVRVDNELETVATEKEVKVKRCVSEEEKEKEITTERTEEEESCPIEEQETVAKYFVGEEQETVAKSFDKGEPETSNAISRIGEGEIMGSFEDSTDTKLQDNTEGREDMTNPSKREVRKRKRMSSRNSAQDQATVGGQHKSLRTRRKVYYGNQSKQPDVEKDDGEPVENNSELEINNENDNTISDGCTQEKISDGRMGEGLELSVGERKAVGQEEGGDVRVNEENDSILEGENVDENRSDLGGTSEDRILVNETQKEDRICFGDINLSGNEEFQSGELIEKENSYGEIQRDRNGDVKGLSSVVTTEDNEFEEEARKEGSTEDSTICDDENNTSGLGVKPLNQNTGKEEEGENLHTESVLDEDTDSYGEMRNRIKTSDSDCVVTTSEIDGMPSVVEKEERMEEMKSQDCLESGREEKPECKYSETGTKEEEEEVEAIQDIDFLSDYDTPSVHQDIISRVNISYSYSSKFDTDWNSLGTDVETCKDIENNTTSNDVNSASVSTPFALPNIDAEDVKLDNKPETVVTEEDATDKEVEDENHPHTNNNKFGSEEEKEKEIIKERKEEESCPVEAQKSPTVTVVKSFDEEEQETSTEILRIGEGERMMFFEDSTDTKLQDGGSGGREDVTNLGRKGGRRRKRKSSRNSAQDQATVGGQHKSLRTRRKVYYGNQSKQPDVEKGDGEPVGNNSELEINKENDNAISDGCTEEKILDGLMGEGLELSVGERKAVGQEEGGDVPESDEINRVLQDENRSDLGGNSEDTILEGETHKEERRSFGDNISDLNLSGNVEIQIENVVEKESSGEEIQRDGNGDVRGLSSVLTTKEENEFEDKARKEGSTEDSAICDAENNTGGLGVNPLNQNTGKEDLLEEGNENLHTESVLDGDTSSKIGDDFSQVVDENSTPSKEDSPYEENQVDHNADDAKENMDELSKAKNLLWDMVVRKRKSSAVGQSLSKRRMIDEESGEKTDKGPSLETVKAGDIAVEKEADVEATDEAVEEESVKAAEDDIETDDLLFGNDEDDLSDYTLFIEEDKAPSKVFLGPFESDTKKKAKMNLSFKDQKEYAKKSKTRSVGSKRRSSKTDITKNSFPKANVRNNSPEKMSWLERKQKAFREKADPLPFTWDLEEKPEDAEMSEQSIAETSIPSKLKVVQEKSESLVCGNSSSIVEETGSAQKPKSKEINTKKSVKRSGRKRLASPLKEYPSSKAQTRLPSSLLQPPSELTSSTSLDIQHTPPKKGRKKKTDSSVKSCITPLKLDTVTPVVPPSNPNKSPCFIEMDDDISFNIKSFSPSFTPDSSKSAPDKNNTSGIEPPPKKRGRPKKVLLSDKDSASCDFKNSKDSAGTDPKLKKAGLIPVTKPQAKIVPSVASSSVTTPPVNPPSSTHQQTCLNLKTVNSNNRKLIRDEKIQLISAKLAQKAKMSTSLQVLESGVVQSRASASPLTKVVVSSSAGSKLKTAAMGSVKGKRESLVKSKKEKKKDAKTGSRKEASPVSTAAVVKRRNPTPVRRPFDLPSTAMKRNQKPSSSIPNTTVYRVDPLPKTAKPKTSSPKNHSESDRTIHTPLPQGVTSVAKPKQTNAKKWKIDKQMKPTKVKAKQRKAPISFKRT